MTSPAVGIVTGANKGIGYAIVRRLVLQWPSSYLHGVASSVAGAAQVPLLLYLTARDRARGEAALASIRSDDGIIKSGILDQGLVDVRFHQLDVASPESIEEFAGSVRKEHPGGIDFLVNNAGTAMDGFNMNVVNTTLGCNYYGLVRTTRAFLPHLKPFSRIVNMGSITGMLSRYSPEVAARFRAARTEEDSTALMRDFAKAVEEDKLDESGFPANRSYGVSKAGVIAFTRALATELDEDESRKDTLVNVCCPGWVVTDMTKGRGTKTVDQGAQTPAMLTLDDLGGRRGRYWTNEKEEDW